MKKSQSRKPCIPPSPNGRLMITNLYILTAFTTSFAKLASCTEGGIIGPNYIININPYLMHFEN